MTSLNAHSSAPASAFSSTAAQNTPAARTSQPPSRAAQDHFDSALRRAGQRADRDDAHTPAREDHDDDAVHENLMATSAVPPPARNAQALPNASLQAAAPVSLTAQAQISQLSQPASVTANAAWSLQLVEPGLPIQQVHIERITGGPQAGVHINLSSNVDSRRLPLDRLRERLAGKGEASHSVGLHTPVQAAADDDTAEHA
jgi:hypothetical protein